MKTWQIILLISLAGLGLIAARLPADMLRHVTGDSNGFALARLQGTVWHGSGELVTDIGLATTISWQIQWTGPNGYGPVLLWASQDAGLNLQGSIRPTWQGMSVRLSGEVAGATLRPVLNRYDLNISGVFYLEDTDIHINNGQPSLASISQLNWSGGQVNYILSGNADQLHLPSLIAKLRNNENGHVQADVVTQDSPPALLVTLTAKNEGVLSISLTRELMLLSGQDWTGDGPMEEVVMSVERKVF